MLKYQFFLLLILGIITNTNQNKSLKFLEFDYNFISLPSQILKGFLDKINETKTINLPQLDNCIKISEISKDSLMALLIKEIYEFDSEFVKGNQNVFTLLYDVGRIVTKILLKYHECFNDIKEDIKIINDIYENFMINLPPNFRIYLDNFKNNKVQIKVLIKEFKELIFVNPYNAGKTFAHIIQIILQNANYEDYGLESYDEFIYFEECYNSIISGAYDDINLGKSIIGILKGSEGLDIFLNDASEFFQLISDRLDYCSKYYKHVNN